MTSHPNPEKAFQLDQILNHKAIFATTGSGKSVLVIQKLFDELSPTPSHLKINFKSKPSH